MIITTEVVTRPSVDIPFYHELEHHPNSPRKRWKETRKKSNEFIGRSVKFSDDKLTCSITTIWWTTKKQDFSNPENLAKKIKRRSAISPISLTIRDQAKSRKEQYLEERGMVSEVTTIRKTLTIEEAMAFLADGKTASTPD